MFFLAQTSSTATETELTTGAWIFVICMLIITLITVVAQWIVFSKAGQYGIASLIPIWRDIALLQIAGMPWWYIILLFIPIINIIIYFAIYLRVARAFGQGALFGLGLFFLGPIFWIMLAFDDYEYVM